MQKIRLKVNGINRRVIEVLKNEEGNGIVAGIVVSAIVLIALILLNTPIRTFIADIWELFANFVEGKLSTLFSS
ncbi:hypothetical protein KQI88_10770 [Alkaliphilus sp. MSJ-5]|uniref:Flagellin Flp1-like domain-containing protein n=1 Tax=Alkaliphilus flagellatus TaxID=2841507 RepID=A0ABS6G349_9FIRM|nr:hypothetical protein [Alkaliphilus flagellatus]MBU5676899.1 hypothetical protein [Alkaliphilus flagellatus]